jgi:hypothetical protein
MSAPLDELYFYWLYEQVADPEFLDEELTYWKVLKLLFQKEFVWVKDVVNDENRISDGIALRIKFLEDTGITDPDPDWMDEACSVLELMVGLSRRIAYEANKGKAYYWFWVLMENLGLSTYNDRRRFTRRQLERIDSQLDDLIFRNYEPSGLGGFFPLQETSHDQRDRELWYQMCDYLLEKELAG